MSLPRLSLSLRDQARFPVPSCQDPDEEAEAAFRSARPRVLARDGHACRFCGFRDSGLYMNVHHLDGDHRNAAEDNLVAACTPCHAVHHLALWGRDRGARIVWLPEIPQAGVSALSRALLVAGNAPDLAFRLNWLDDLAERGGAAVRGAEAIEADLAARAGLARDRLGTDDPRELASALACTARPAGGLEDLLAPYRFVIGPRVGSLPLDESAFRHVSGWFAEGGHYEGLTLADWTPGAS